MENKEQKKDKQDKRRIVPVKPYTITELARIYGVCPRTLKKWINEFKNELGKKVGRYYTIPQVIIILDNLNIPHEKEVD